MAVPEFASLTRQLDTAQAERLRKYREKHSRD